MSNILIGDKVAIRGTGVEGDVVGRAGRNLRVAVFDVETLTVKRYELPARHLIVKSGPVAAKTELLRRLKRREVWLGKGKKP